MAGGGASGSKILAIQQDTVDRLIADPFFQYIPVIPQDRKDIANEITRSLAALAGQNGKNGVCVVAIAPHANVNKEYQSASGPFFNRIFLLYRVLENRLVNEGANGTGIRALEIAEKITNRLHQYLPAGCVNPLTVTEPTITLGNDPNYVSYDVLLWTSAGLTDVPPGVVDPVLALGITDLFLYNFETATGAGPSNGCIRLNNATPSAATIIYVHKNDQAGTSINPTLAKLVANTQIKFACNRRAFRARISAINVFATYYQFIIDTIVLTNSGLFGAGEELMLNLDRVSLTYLTTIHATNTPNQGEAIFDAALTVATRVRVNAASQDLLVRSNILDKFVAGSAFSYFKDANNHAEYRITSVVTATGVDGLYYEFGLSFQRITGAVAAADQCGFTAQFIGMTSALAGASVWWKNDVANPIPRSGYLYPSSPVPFFQGELVKAKAFLSGYLTSNTVSFVVP